MTRSRSPLVLPPHRDDVVLRRGAWLAGHGDACVVTGLAGTPSAPRRLTEWDAADDALLAALCGGPRFGDAASRDGLWRPHCAAAQREAA